MAKKSIDMDEIDIDEEALEEAKRVLGAGSYTDTVNTGLREIIARAARQREIERFTAPGQLDITNSEVMASAWR